MKSRILGIYIGAVISIASVLLLLDLRGIWLIATVGTTMLFWILLSYRVKCPRCARPILLRQSGSGYKWVGRIPDECPFCKLELR